MGSFSLPWPFGKRGPGGGTSKKSAISSDEDRRLEEFGITLQLSDYVRGFTVATFRDFPLQDDRVNESISNDLTEWQEGHATLVLSKVKEISQLRYTLCPRHLKDNQFWRIYFLLVKSYVAPYEIRAIQKAKLATMGLENEKLAGKGAIIEVEMTVAKGASDYAETLLGNYLPLLFNNDTGIMDGCMHALTLDFFNGMGIQVLVGVSEGSGITVKVQNKSVSLINDAVLTFREQGLICST